MRDLFSFEKLEVYKYLKKFVKDIYSITEEYPDKEKFGLVSQINRASVSVISNVVEGNSRESKKDKAHFIQLAYSSLMEVLCQLDISVDLGYLTKVKYDEMRVDIVKISKMLSGLRKYYKGG
jgi:four helix bundle protein